ncbi:hypothetical protein COCON_G00212140 [Conger conger]|uniref:Transmembrane protein 106 C-terminal domain-containing protein n=1 Tax=Conger conger TaxID=82655 RepID=A0A9Q1HQ33_CONCO|nr:hypothetical protein COCON_G00212140 [Conger conger]
MCVRVRVSHYRKLYVSLSVVLCVLQEAVRQPVGGAVCVTGSCTSACRWCCVCYRKLYVSLSVVLCILVCALILFFLFPRSVLLSPVAVKSVYVFFTPSTVEMTITNVINITNNNFAVVQATDLSIQVLFYDTVLGTASISNVTTIQPRSVEAYTYAIPIQMTDEGLNSYCKSTAIRIHTLFLHLQMTMKVFYLSHSEQLSLDTFEYIDCGTNTTVPHFF